MQLFHCMSAVVFNRLPGNPKAIRDFFAGKRFRSHLRYFPLSRGQLQLGSIPSFEEHLCGKRAEVASLGDNRSNRFP